MLFLFFFQFDQKFFRKNSFFKLLFKTQPSLTFLIDMFLIKSMNYIDLIHFSESWTLNDCL